MKKTETRKYIAVIDPKVAIDTAFKYVELTTKTLIEAMSEANKLMDEDVYLIDLYEKQAGGDKEKVFYSPVLRNRGNGWNVICDEIRSCYSLAFWYKYANASEERKAYDYEWVA